jgi:hypothetical protein
MNMEEIDNQLNGDFKFNNCKHRSSEKITKTIHRCSCQGGNYQQEGYQCLSRNIFSIEPNICAHCASFEKKD